MIRSMTGYAQVAGSGANTDRIWELRAVNHRHLEVVLHIPDSILAIEGEIRRRVSQVIKRGRVELWLRQNSSEEDAGISANLALLQQLRGTMETVSEIWGSPLAQLSPLDLLRWPGVLQASRQELQPEPLLALLDQGLRVLQESREREGSALAEILLQKIQAMEKILASLRARLPALEGKLVERLDRRLSELQQQVDPGRWEQELVFYLHRQDIAEEMERLSTHLVELRQVLQRDEPVGRRLDFLVQECNREANTLGSKAGDQEVSQAAIELKVLVEQIREQVQNVE
ncbi:YicC/YloC family endoribonuclease [Acidithiobacillus acidisediminis]|uniref:YicC/YloC family endoribonuclease n=1 Tax=Acidithiobacillus acidisediminis TaxID=2937799 RepID=UPI0020107948|nr:YicC/YloC family endoribonuclease [Acidithiobacillus sp. S30A2]